MLVDLKSKARRTIVVQLPMSMASPKFPSSQMTVRRSRSVRFQAAPVPVDVRKRMPPVLTIMPGETVCGLPEEVLKLDAVAAALHPSRRELVVLKKYRPEKPAAKQSESTKARRRK